MSNTIFVNPDKKKRAEDIYLILSGKKPLEKTSVEDIESKRERYTELLKEQDVDLKDKDACIFAIYKLMAGAVRTEAQQAKVEEVKEQAKSKKKSFAREEKDDDDDN